MELVIAADYAALSRQAAAFVARRIRANPNLVLGLATGSTPLGMYRELVRLHREEGLDFSRVTTFNLDEYIGLAPHHPESYHDYMYRHFFNHININTANIHIPRGDAPDIEAECRRYEAAIAACGGIDLQILGIGVNGHIGFNEPDAYLEIRTHRVALAPETIRANARFFPDPAAVPQEAITMGVGTIIAAREILLLASGPAKREVVAKLLHGPITTTLPASVLQLHQNVTLMVDRAAATRLKTPQTG